MSFEKYKYNFKSPLKKATLCFLVDGNKVLLGLKKRGFAVGKWNGFGGKVDNGETIQAAVVREMQEEALVIPTDLVHVAVLDFHFLNKSDWGQQVHVYISATWKGVPTETEEMSPKWFDINKLPFEKMWVDDVYWLLPVLSGKKIRGRFLFGENEEILEKEIQIVKNLKN